jgi:N-methylhydantoinase A
VHGAVIPAVQQYIRNIETGLIAKSINAPVSIMQSSGGMCSTAKILQQLGLIVESGPAAGVISAIETGKRLGICDLISFDMGGTTAKATLVHGGRVNIHYNYEVGGGSLACVDDVGHLHVGPQCAGADPGPACYGFGGIKPTVTDANVVLGRLNPNRFAGGQIKLDIKAARQAIEHKISQPLGLSIEQAAEGIVALANAQMVRALQLVSIERGFDPRELTMVAFGGAGPRHGAQAAMELGCKRVIIPLEAGVQSARGLLVADARRDFSQAIDCIDSIDLHALQKQYADMAHQGYQELYEAGFLDSAITSRLAIDIRYAGQAYELIIEYPEHPTFTKPMVHRINSLFHDEYHRRYGHNNPSAAVEWINLRVSVVGEVMRPAPWPAP